MCKKCKIPNTKDFKMKNVDNLINENERLEDLDLKNLKIIQNSDFFCFGMDAVLLSWFVTKTPKKNLRILDLGTGNGILPLLIYGKSQNCHIDGVDIQSELVEMAKRSIKLNKLEAEIQIIEGDLRDKKIILPNIYDLVVSNPPYMRINDGLKNLEKAKTISRHEVSCSIDDLIKCSRRSLKDHGYLYLVHRPDRLADLLSALRNYKIEPKRLQFVHSRVDKQANLVLVEARKGAKPGLNIDAPLIVYDNQGKYSASIREIYRFN